MSYMALAVMTMLTALVTRNLIAYSHFSIDFENLLVFPLQSYLYLGLIISLSLVLFMYCNWQGKWIEKQKSGIQIKLISLILSNLVVYGLLKFISGGPDPEWTAVGITSFTFLVDLFINPKEKSFIWLISWLIILSAFLSIILFNGYLKYDIIQRTAMASSLHNNYTTKAIEDFDYVKKALRKDSIIDDFLSVPFSFKIHRFEFDEINAHIFRDSSKSEYQYIFNAYDRNGEPMLYESYTSLSYYDAFKYRSDTINENVFFDPIRNAYLTSWTYEIEGYDNGPFTVFLEQYPTPALGKSSSLLETMNYLGKYDYAYYKKGKLVSYSNPLILNDDDYAVSLNLGESLMISRDQYSDLFLKVGEGKLIKLSRKSARLIKPVSLFSFMFLYLSFLLLIIGAFQYRFRFLPDFLLLKFGKVELLKNRLQLSIVSLIVFSFIIIGVVTIYYFQNISGQYDKDILREKAMSIALDIKSRTRHQVTEIAMLQDLSRNLTEISRRHNVNLNLYHADGKLALSTFPKVFEKNQYPDQMNPDVKEAFAQNKNQIKIDFLSNYAGQNFQHAFFPLLNPAGDTKLFVHSLHVPVIKSNSKVSDFVGTLLNIYVFLFLLAGAIALAVSNYITQPLKSLGDKIKKLKLGSKNERLEWNTNDELGQLIANYNEMVSKLDDSAKLIAHTERDMAWREMAKQVAHEIKNPLTPMKLSIQYLKRAIETHPDNTDELVDRVSKTLIEQIDNLSEIAGAFSNFGKLPNATNEKVVLNEIVEAVHDLFRKRNDMEINMYEPIDELYVFADKNALVRILNNIIKNAIQAIPTDRRGHIDVKLYKKDKWAIVKISDNGVGIPDHRKEKVFMPNFTTKSSGTGLGLAICANMVESFNGRLFFESVEGEGTDFFLEIPLMHVNDNFVNPERVLLE